MSRHLAWLFSAQVFNLPPYSEFVQEATAEETHKFFRHHRKHLHATEPSSEIPPSIMELADQVYEEVFSADDVQRLFGSNWVQHPAHCEQWMVLIQRYIQRLSDASQEMPAIDPKCGLKKCVTVLADSLRYLLLSDLTRDQKRRKFGCLLDTPPPLLTPGFVRDLVLMMTPNEKDPNGAAAWKAAWTSVKYSTQRFTTQTDKL